MENKELLEIMDSLVESEIIFLRKVDERLKGYACGYHKQLHKMIKNRNKRLVQSQRKVKNGK